MRNGVLRIVDLASTNGTFVDHLQVREAMLPRAAKLRLGAVTLDFQVLPDVIRLPLPQRDRYGALLGRSAGMRALFALLDKAASSEASMLIEGESGTGKELVAEAVHQHSPRADGPFVVVDCAALPANLIESELFGHEQGAFSGATSNRAGAFEEADGGTIFLDEVGELDKKLQPRLLRALDRKKVKRVGSSSYRDVDVRVIAATNRDLDRMVSEGAFREDLFYRLAVLRVFTPPLRDRKDDIEPLARHFLADWQRRNPGRPPFELTPKAIEALERQPWIGNVRQLRNAVERAATLASVDGDYAVTEETSPSSQAIDFASPYPEARAKWIEEFEREYVQHALDAADGNVARAARERQIDRAHLFRLIKRHDLKRR
jgi:DNA-binding NtrC family response regulator